MKIHQTFWKHILKPHTHVNIVTWGKGVRVSILSGQGASSAPMSVSKTTFTHTLKFSSSPQYRHYEDMLPKLWAIGPWWGFMPTSLKEIIHSLLTLRGLRRAVFSVLCLKQWPCKHFALALFIHPFPLFNSCYWNFTFNFVLLDHSVCFLISFLQILTSHQMLTNALLIFTQ